MASKREIYDRAQKSLVAALMYDGSGTDRVLELINENDFEIPSLAKIMSAVAEVARRNEVPTVVNVAEALENNGDLKAAGGLSTLYSLRAAGEKALLAAQPEVYARIVQESSVKSKVDSLLDDSKEQFKDDSGTPAKRAIETLQNDLSQQIVALGDNATITNVEEYVNSDEYEELLKQRVQTSIENAENAEGLQGLPYPLETLNKYTGGIMPQQLVTVAAKTGVGKSVFAVMIALSVAKAGKTVLFFSLEMSPNEIIDRIVANLSGVPLDHLRQGLYDFNAGQINESEKALVDRARQELSEMKIIIDTDANQTIDSIRSKAIRQSQSPEGLNCVVVDYLQLVGSAGRFNNRQEEVASISRSLKLLAKSMDIPVVALSQLNRKRDEDEEALPSMDNIRESGAIAQDSDVVILLHRPKRDDNSIQDTTVILEKNRNGSGNKKIRTATNLECANLRERKGEGEAQGEKMTDEALSNLEAGMDMDSDIDMDTISI